VDGGGYVGEISMLDSGDVVRVDQQELETVIPSPGGGILVSSLIYGVS
jgi:DNA/RNA-binding protein KIN17